MNERPPRTSALASGLVGAAIPLLVAALMFGSGALMRLAPGCAARIVVGVLTIAFGLAKWRATGGQRQLIWSASPRS